MEILIIYLIKSDLSSKEEYSSGTLGKGVSGGGQKYFYK